MPNFHQHGENFTSVTGQHYVRPLGFTTSHSWGAIVRRVLLAASVIGAIAAGAYFFCVSQVDDQIRVHAEKLFNEHYASKGLVAKVAGGRLIEGQGVEVRGLRITDRASGELLVEVDEIFMANGATLDQLVGELPPAERIIVRRMRMRTSRDPQGNWSAASLFPPPRISETPPPTIIENSQLEVFDAQDPTRRKLVLRDVYLEVTYHAGGSTDQRSPQFRIQGRLEGDHFQQTTVEGVIETATGGWSVQGATQRLDFSPALVGSLPRDVQHRLSEVAQLQAKSQLQYRVKFDPQLVEPLTYVVWGSVDQGRWENPRLPRPLTKIRSQVYFDKLGMSLEGFSAQMGQTALQLSFRRRGWTPHSPFLVQGTAQNLLLDESLYRVLPEMLQTSWRRFSPAGQADLSLRLEWDGQRWLPEGTLLCKGVSFAYDAFPYRMEDGVGAAAIKNDVLTLHLHAQMEGQPIRIESVLEHPGPYYTGWVEVASQRFSKSVSESVSETDSKKAPEKWFPIPITDRIVAALPNSTRKIVREMRVSGAFSVWARYERKHPQQTNLNYHFKIGAHDCTVNYEKFPYQIDRIRGELEGKDGQWIARKFSGYNGAAFITCNGGWNNSPDGELALDFAANDVPLEEELRRALSPGAQRLWLNLQPQGAMDELLVKVRYPFALRRLSLEVHAAKRPSNQNIEGRSITIEPVWFPYRWDNVTGAIHYHDGKITLKRVRGWHGSTRATTEGVCSIDAAGGWDVEFQNLTVDRLEANHELTGALPGQLGSAVASLHVAGPVRLYGNMSLARGAAPNAPLLSQWNMTFQLMGGSIDCGLKLENVFGAVNLIGRRDAQGFRSGGEVAIDSLIFKDIQFTHVAGPMWMDEARILFGGRVPQDAAVNTALASRPADAAHRPRSLTANVLGGQMVGDAQVALYGNRDFEMRASYYDGDLRQFARQFAPAQRNMTGKAYGSLVLRGSQLGTHTWQGGGGIRLRQAQLYELPEVVSLLKLLSIREPDPTAFTTSDMDFRILGEVAYFDRIDFKGDAISLKGTGEVDLKGNVNVSFYTLVGRTEYLIPGLNRFLGEASQRFFLIQVDGNLKQLKMTKRVLPGVNELIQRLFPEATAKR